MSSTAPTYEGFIEDYPVFSSISENLINSKLTFSANFLDSSEWGDFYSEGIELLTAHILVLNNIAGDSIKSGIQMASGPVSSVSGAGISTSFSASTWNDKSKMENWLSKTIYGQELLMLRETIVAPCLMSV